MHMWLGLTGTLLCDACETSFDWQKLALIFHSIFIFKNISWFNSLTCWLVCLFEWIDIKKLFQQKMKMVIFSPLYCSKILI